MFYNPKGTRNEVLKSISNSHIKNVSDDQISDGCYLPIENGKKYKEEKRVFEKHKQLLYEMKQIFPIFSR